MITGAIVIFFFLLWVGVTLYRRHQRRRRQRSQQGGDGSNDNAEALQEPAVVQLVDLPLTSRNRRWETQMQLEEHEERPLASGRNQVEIQIVDDLPPAPAFSQRPHSPSAPPLPEHLSEQVKKLERNKKLDSIVDRNLNKDYNDHEVEIMIQVALLCTQPTPEDRPSMSEVVRMLEGEGLAERWEEWQHVEVNRRQD